MAGKYTYYTIDILCARCQTHLYKYKKEGGGELIKCYKHLILQDDTNGDLKCPKCGKQFARDTMIHGKPANKIVSGAVIVKGHHGKSK